MANKTVNKKIFRAMSIGLAAMMTVQPILATPVFADDADDENKYSADNEHSSESADEARESVDEAQSVAEAVEATLESVNPGEAGTTEVTSEDGSVEVIDNAQAIIDAVHVEIAAPENNTETSGEETASENPTTDETAEDTQTITVSALLEQTSDNLEAVNVELTIAEAKADVISGFSTTDGVDSEAKKANDAVDNANTAISEETAANEAIEAAVEKGNESVADAVENYNKGANAVSEANTIVVEAEATYTELVNTVSDATTVEEAQKAYDDLDALISDTQIKVADKKVALDAAKEALSTMVDRVKEHEADAEAAREAFEKAKADYEAAATEYNSGKEAYANHAKEIEAFNEAYETAKTNLEAAEANLQTVSDKADALATAVKNAQTALANSGALARAETVTESINKVANASEGGSYWTDMDKLFESMMRNYYLPEKLGVSVENAEKATFAWNNKATDIDKFDKPFNKNNDYNYCIVTCPGEKPKYFNYKRETDAKGNPLNSIVIFEKRDVEVEANRLLNQGNNKDMAVVKQNQNFFDYKDGKEDLAKSTLVQSSDSDFQNFLGLGNKYKNLKEQAEAEKAAVETAQKKVETLKGVMEKVPKNTIAIGELKENNVSMSKSEINSLIKTLSDLGVDFGGKNIEELTLDDIKDALKAEESKLEALENRVNDLKNSMDDVAIQLAETIERINTEAEETTDVSRPTEDVTPGSTETVPEEAVTPGSTETVPEEVVTPGNTETTSTEAVTPGNTETTPTEATTTDDATATPTEDTTSSTETTASTSSSEATSDVSAATITPAVVLPTATAPSLTAIPTAEAAVAGARVAQTQLGGNGAGISEISHAGVAGARVDRPDGISGDGEILETGDGTLLDEELIKESDKIVEDDVIKNKKAVTIKDDEVPLSSLAEDEAKKISWWWLLLIALLGATGEEMYRRHKNKKEERERLNSEGK